MNNPVANTTTTLGGNDKATAVSGIATFNDLKNYLRTDTPLYKTGADVFGHPYGPFTIDSIPTVSTETFNALSDVADDSFWSPYK